MRFYDEILRRYRANPTEATKLGVTQLQGATVLACDNVTEYFYALSAQEKWAFPKDFPNCTPPFKNFFLETTSPSRIYSEECGTQTWEGAARWGFHFRVHDFNDLKLADFKQHIASRWSKSATADEMKAHFTAHAAFSATGKPAEEFDQWMRDGHAGYGQRLVARTRWFVEVSSYYQLAPDWPVELPLASDYLQRIGSAGKAFLFISEAGEPWQFEHNYPGEAWAWEGVPGETDALDRALSSLGKIPGAPTTPGSHAREFFRILFQPCVLAINFANCKNVVMVDEGPPRQQRRAAERAGAPLTVFKTLQIGPIAKLMSLRGRKGLSGIKLRMHIRRGGLRDYRHGNGLFGKWKGLFWWEDHIVGDDTVGIVEKDYQIQPPTV